MRFVDLTRRRTDAERLTNFYETLYVQEFPDANERESLDNMLYYLDRDGEEDNAYIVTLAYDGEVLVGGAICDYFVRSNCGVIEFLTVAPDRRARGTGSSLARHVERRIEHAADICGQTLEFVIAEINDPFRHTLTSDNIDPFERLHFWDRLGYRRMAFPYAQPALSCNQRPVANLLLSAKPISSPSTKVVSTRQIVTFLRDYLIYAMRIAEPSDSPEFVKMCEYLGRRDSVAMTSLTAYTGDDVRILLDVRELQSESDPDFASAMRILQHEFRPGLADPEPNFRKFLHQARATTPHHFWALRAKAGEPVRGFTSFFSLPSAGFGSYVTLEPPLRDPSLFEALIARIERTMMRDNTSTRGWYVECSSDAFATGLYAYGFSRVAVCYNQPSNGVRSRLLYKEYGASYDYPKVTKASFLAATRDIAHLVYGIERPDESPSIAEMARQLATVPGEDIPFVHATPR